MFWVPQTGGIGVGISILSYDGGVQFGLVTDKKLCPEPQKIIDRFAPEFETLVYAVLLAPWDDEIDPQVAERALAATEALAEAAGHVAADGEPARAAHAGGGGKQERSGDAAATAAPRRRKRSAFAAARAASRG
jgi:hypothetical protein